MERQNLIKNFQSEIGHTFHDSALLELVFVHRSYLNENTTPDGQSNERLEFLGDAVLEHAVTEYIYRKLPELPEGELTKIRSALVRGTALTEVASVLRLNVLIQLSRGEERNGGRDNQVILADTLEALIGAFYLDAGYEAVREFINKYINSRLEEVLESEAHRDPKSLLQEIYQEKSGVTPEYRVIQEQGPDHAKEYVVGAFAGRKELGRGSGSSKQKAEGEAAKDALGTVIKT
jgi:ribonuclease-3